MFSKRAALWSRSAPSPRAGCPVCAYADRVVRPVAQPRDGRTQFQGDHWMNRNFIAVIAITLMAGALPLAAQNSSLQGVVTDPQGAIIPGAIVTMTNTDTSATRKEVSGDTGIYRILQVLPGPYKVEVQKPGFKTNTTSLSLQVDVPATLNLTL